MMLIFSGGEKNIRSLKTTDIMTLRGITPPAEQFTIIVMRMRNSIFLLTLIFCNCLLFPQSSLHSDENILRFAKYLSNEGDFLRASEEYDKLFTRTANPVYNLKSAASLIRLGNYWQALNKIDLLYAEAYGKESDLFRVISHLYLEDEMNVVRIPEASEEYAGNFELLSLYDKARRSEFAEERMKDLLASSKLTDEIRTDISLKFSELKLKNVGLAALLSAIIPGSGKIYTGDYSDGITAFITTSLFAYLAVSNFQAKHNFRGYLFGAAAVGFYAGNIYGSYSAARKRNLDVLYNFSVKLDGIFRANSYFLTGKAREIYEN